MDSHVGVSNAMDRQIANGSRRTIRHRALMGVAGLLTIGVLGASFMVPSLPSVALASVVIDQVYFGKLDMIISGPGKLVPAEERIIAAHVRAMVEEVAHDPGAVLSAGDKILQLLNPDTDLELLEARRELTVAEAELVKLRANLGKLLLDQGSLIRRVEFDQLDAQRVATAYKDLAQGGAISELDLKRAQDRLVELGELVEIEKRNKSFLADSRKAQLDSQRAKNRQLSNLVRFRERQVTELTVTTPISGVLQEITVVEGQWVEAGDMLARVSETGNLKATLQMPQTKADKVSPGQIVSIDTRIGVVKGHVYRVDPAVQDGAVIVDVVLDEVLPKGARAELTVYGTINAGGVGNTLSIRRPPNAIENASGEMFRLDAASSTATRVQVVFGESAGDRIELLEGGSEGDQFIVSDTSTWNRYNMMKLER